MDYKQFDSLCRELIIAYKKITDEACYTTETKATEAMVLNLEKELQVKLPGPVRSFFTDYTAGAEMRVFLPDEFCDKLPGEFEEIFSACFILSINEMKEAEISRRFWIETCFADEENEYDRVWYNKLGLMTVETGDIIALDIGADPENPPVVYLSHDGGEAHGYVLGKDFESYILNLVKAGACGQEDWQMMPFMEDKESGIDPDCENAEAFRRIIGFDIIDLADSDDTV
ncbi:MAG: SMI1/KNR4 family protein [Lachnospiraceae bacterium]|nr:SMI1/KNR4 family protein [Lachnospiraceae bacterium]